MPVQTQNSSTDTSFIPSSSRPRYGTCNLNKRKQDWEEGYAIVENDLLQLCRTGEWASVIRRCRSNPEEAIPTLVSDYNSIKGISSKRSKREQDRKFLDVDETESVYYDTPLGIVCSSKQLDSDALREVVVALVMACPGQVRASQWIPGNTPLRDAILNPHCSPFVLRVLLDAEIMCQRTNWEGNSVLAKKDSNCHRPIDHIIMGVQLRSSSRSTDIFKQYFEHEAFRTHSNGDKEDLEYSPLIKLLSSRSCPSDEIHCHYDEELLASVKLLMEKDSLSLTCTSKLTGCSVIHLALRNHGHHVQLINLLLSHPDSKNLMGLRNRFGDIPLHVACSVGVPLDVLKTIVKATRGAVPVERATPKGTHPLIWCSNSSGDTAADLLWIRHVEGYRRFDVDRSFYPLKRNGLTNDRDYKELLQQAVNHFHLRDSQSLQLPVEDGFESFLDSIALLVTESSVSSRSDPTFLHDVCRCSPPATNALPSPLVHLFLSLCKQNLLTEDQYGMIPLHYLVQSSGHEMRKLKDYVLHYLKAAPTALRLTNSEGRLPLHILLDHASDIHLVHEMVARFPESIDIRDPKTNLAPFLLAAQNTSSSLDIIFSLLSQSPSRCQLFEEIHDIDIHDS